MSETEKFKPLEEPLKPSALELLKLADEEGAINDKIEDLNKKRNALFEQRFPGMSEVEKVLSEAAAAVEVSVLADSAKNLLKVLMQGEKKAGHFKVMDDPSQILTLGEDGAWGAKKGDTFIPKKIADGIYLLKEEGEVRLSPAAAERLGDAIRKNQIYFEDDLKRISFPM